MPHDPAHHAFYEANRRSWDERVAIHVASRSYDRASFIAGERAPHEVEAAELGDVAGRTLLHLQCHFGMDTLTWARRGAIVTGIDFSAPAIEAARALASDSGLSGRFIEANVYDAPALLDEQFDIVYVNVGALCWLPDVRGWARVAAGFVRPGGRLYVYDVHPALMTVDLEHPDHVLAVEFPYFEVAQPQAWDTPETYTDGPPLEHTRTYEWNHGLGEIVTAIIEAGLRLDFLHEHRELPWQAAAWLEPVEAKRDMWRLPDRTDRLPMMYSLQATKLHEA